MKAILSVEYLYYNRLSPVALKPQFMLLTQSYVGAPKKLSRKPKAVFLWHLNENDSFKKIHDQNNVLPDDK